MLSIKKKKEQLYLYLTPVEHEVARWEILDEQELKARAEENLLEEGARLFKIDKEVPIHFEKITHLDL
jgi:hypothetical protein